MGGVCFRSTISKSSRVVSIHVCAGRECERYLIAQRGPEVVQTGLQTLGRLVHDAVGHAEQDVLDLLVDHRLLLGHHLVGQLVGELVGHLVGDGRDARYLDLDVLAGKVNL